jgi:Abortive infection alpha
VAAARPADATRPRPQPHPRSGPARGEPRSLPPTRPPGRGLARPDVQTGQMVAAAGSAIVTAARVGRLLGRSGWRIARQLPGVSTMEQQAQRLRQAAAAEMFRLLEMPQNLFAPATGEEQRVMMLVQNAGTDPEPLRTAMTELLERSADTNHAKSRDYLFGTIVSQLVPDEARILAALAGGTCFAAVDVVAKQVGRSSTRTLLSNASTIGAAAGISLPGNTPTYLTRLRNFGLIDFGRPGDGLSSQFDALAADPAVAAVRAGVDATKHGSTKLVQKSVKLSSFGAEFWAACAPARLPLAGRPD